MKDPLHDIVRCLRVADADDSSPLGQREWLVTNGLGGYSSATVAGASTRKYHGLLVAALPNPLGRIVMLNHVAECLCVGDDARLTLTAEERIGREPSVPGMAHLTEFRLEAGMPVWTFDFADTVLERRILMPHAQNTTFILYRVVRGSRPITLELRPAVHFRHYEHEVTALLQPNYRLTLGDVYEISCQDAPAMLRLRLYGESSFGEQAQEIAELHYRVEKERGYAHEGRLWSPGVFSVKIAPGDTAALVASSEPLETMLAMSPEQALHAERERRRRLLRTAPPAAREGAAAELVLAADQFVIKPAGRLRHAARAAAEGDEIRTVIAGYHWFTDWGRDTMISLDGLTLATGRTREAASILRSFASYVRDGLIPNMFPDGSNDGLYHTADATLWFFHAAHRYFETTRDEALLERLLPTLIDIAQHHLRGTRFGIGVDPEDGLLRQGADGYQLTWMDAKCDGWVVTPRRGKAVEINALWYNALCVLEAWTRHVGRGEEAEAWAAHAYRARTSFNRRFWFDVGGYLYDVVDGPGGDSSECRPNQVFAISLPHPVLDESRWASVVRVVEERLVTPFGLRSLAPGSEHYAPRYFGSLRERDAAYHQGTVWGWLIGGWVDAWRKVHRDDSADARRWLDGLVAHLSDFGIGSIAEIFDAEPPYTARGCVAQAWSVAEVLRQLLASAPRSEQRR